MKALQIIAALSIANSFSLHSMQPMQHVRNRNKNEDYSGLEWYHSRYASRIDISAYSSVKGSDIYPYCTSSWRDAWTKNTKDPYNCRILNAYLLLNRRPQESVEQQLEFYKKDLTNTTEQLNSTIEIFKKNTLGTRQKFLERIIPQIQQANLSGKPQDRSIQEQVGMALKNISSSDNYRHELAYLKEAVESANQCDFLDSTK